MQCNSVKVNLIHKRSVKNSVHLFSVFPQFINKEIGSIRLLDFGQLEAGAKIYSFVSSNC